MWHHLVSSDGAIAQHLPPKEYLARSNMPFAPRAIEYARDRALAHPERMLNTLQIEEPSQEPQLAASWN